MKSIVYVGEFDFAKRNALSKRVLYNCLAINEGRKYSITLTGKSNVRHQQYSGFEVLNTSIGTSYTSRVLNFLLRGVNILKIINELKVKPEVIIYYGTTSRILLPLLVYCRINKIKVVADVADWYDYAHLPMGRFGLFALDLRISFRYLLPKCDGLIVISRFLEDYFRQKNKNIILIPPLSFAENIAKPHLEKSKKELAIVYAGFPGKKDLIENIVKAILNLKNEKTKVKLHLLGITHPQLEKICSFKIAKSNIICHGPVEQEAVYSFLERADFSIFVRPNARYSNAGFPTKFVESLSLGLPVITNLTSDLGFYLRDGYNGFVLESEETFAIEQTIKFLSSHSELFSTNHMRENARETFHCNFNYKLYVERVNKFLDSLVQRNI